TAQDAADFGFEGAEVAAEVGTAELVVERGRADRAFEHDVERGSDASGLPGRRPFPKLLVTRNAQVRHRIAGEARLRLRAAPGRALVPDLTAGAGRSAGKGRDRGGMVMRFHL